MSETPKPNYADDDDYCESDILTEGDLERGCQFAGGCCCEEGGQDEYVVDVGDGERTACCRFRFIFRTALCEASGDTDSIVVLMGLGIWRSAFRRAEGCAIG